MIGRRVSQCYALVWAAALTVVLANACASRQHSSDTATRSNEAASGVLPSPLAIPSNWVRRANAHDGYELALPPDWTVMRSGPEAALEASGNGSATFALGISPADPSSSASTVASQLVSELPQLGDLQGPVQQRKLKLPSGDAIFLSYEDVVGGQPVLVMNYVELHGDHVYLLTYNDDPANAGTARGIFQGIAQTLQWI